MKRRPPPRKSAAPSIKPSERKPTAHPRPRPTLGGKPAPERPGTACVPDQATARAAQGTMPEREGQSAHVVPVEVLARAAVEAAIVVERAVLDDKKHADRAIAHVLKERRDLGQPDRQFVSQAVFALFRWKGWLDPLPLDRPEARLLFAWLIDSPTVHPVCKVWARVVGRDPSRLFSLGGAPNWTARAEGWKRLHEGMRRHGRPLATLPQLAPRAPAAAAGLGVAEDEVPRAAQRPPVAAAALGPGPGGRAAEASGTSWRDSG